MSTYVETVRAGVRSRLQIRPYNLLLLLTAIAAGLIIFRYAAGLGAATNLSDGYPWGLWIAFDVVVGTALACGGYAMAVIAYVFNEGKYHPLVRPAILTSALGYSMAGLSVAIDVGRPWHLWKVPTQLWKWNVNSVLLEVAVCIMAYIVVLWLELSPALLERWRDSKSPRLKAFAERTLPLAEKSLFWIVGMGLILPTLHQSSLGSLMLLAGPRLHGLWSTQFLPLFFLLTSLAMGYAIVVFEAAFASKAFNHKPAAKMLANLGRFAAMGSALFVALRFIDLIVKGRIALVARFDLYAVLFWVETLLYLAPVFILLRRKRSLGSLVRAAMLVVLAGSLYRFDTFLVAFDPGPGWHYFPSITEQLITVGLVAGELAVYVAVVKNFPILAGRKPAPAR